MFQLTHAIEHDILDIVAYNRKDKAKHSCTSKSPLNKHSTRCLPNVLSITTALLRWHSYPFACLWACVLFYTAQVSIVNYRCIWHLSWSQTHDWASRPKCQHSSKPACVVRSDQSRVSDTNMQLPMRKSLTSDPRDVNMQGWFRGRDVCKHIGGPMQDRES